MRAFCGFVLLPATVILGLMTVLDLARGNSTLGRAIVIGAVGGLVAACAYDLFRLPFVVAAADNVGPAWLRLPLFKVFPRFGAMLLAQRFTPQQSDSQFPLLTHLVGWTYHLSNGVTFGVMYMALIGDARRRSWAWAIALAVCLEAAMIFTPYTHVFGIALTARFVVVTLTAHLIFGVALGLYARRADRHWPTRAGADSVSARAGAAL